VAANFGDRPSCFAAGERIHPARRIVGGFFLLVYVFGIWAALILAAFVLSRLLADEMPED